MEYDLALNGWSFKEYIPHQKVKLHGIIDGDEHIARLYAPRDIEILSLQWIVWKVQLINLETDETVLEREVDGWEGGMHTLQKFVNTYPSE